MATPNNLTNPTNPNHTFFDQKYVVNQYNFPTKLELTEMLSERNFNQLLALIRTKILSADTLMQKYCLITNLELSDKYQTKTIEDVKTFLLSKCYTITYVEDASNNITGWKLYWK